MIQVRLNSNAMRVTGTWEVPNGNRVWMPFNEDPQIDYRDEDTVWVWISDNLCVEMDRKLVDRLHRGFNDDVSEQEMSDEYDRQRRK